MIVEELKGTVNELNGKTVELAEIFFFDRVGNPTEDRDLAYTARIRETYIDGTFEEIEGFV